MFLGDFPKEQEILELAVKIAAEALTNAVRPKGTIEPVCGLAGLIWLIFAAGGVVTIEWTPRFSLTVKLICTC